MIELLYTFFVCFCLSSCPRSASLSLSLLSLHRIQLSLDLSLLRYPSSILFRFFLGKWMCIYFPFSIKISSPYAAYMEPDLWRTINWLHSGSLETLSHWGDSLLLTAYCDTLHKDKKKRHHNIHTRPYNRTRAPNIFRTTAVYSQFVHCGNRTFGNVSFIPFYLASKPNAV